jgi:hypothetical protein
VEELILTKKLKNMKTKKLSILILLLLGIQILNSCKFLEGKGSITTDNNTLCLDYKNSEKSSLDTDLVKEMTKLYQTNSRFKNDSVMAIRFDLETLKKFIYHIELEAKKENKPSKDLGIRIYYARYPKKDTWSKDKLFEKDLSGFLGNTLTEQYEGKHTLIMIPTIYDGNEHLDYNPLFTSRNVQNRLLNKNNLSIKEDGESSKQQTFGIMPQESDNLKQNHGELYPPYSEVGMEFVHN